MIVDGLALRAEDPAVGLEQVAALHARGAGPGADEQGHVGAVEGGLEVIGDVRARQQGKGAIVQLHGGAFGRLQGWGDLQEPQAHRNIRAEELPGGNAEEQGVADLARRAGYGDVYGSGHDGRLDRCGWVRCIEPGQMGVLSACRWSHVVHVTAWAAARVAVNVTGCEPGASWWRRHGR